MNEKDAFSRYVIPDDYRPRDAEFLTVDIGNGTACGKSGPKTQIKIPRDATHVVIDDRGKGDVGVYFQKLGAKEKFIRGLGASYVDKRLLSRLAGYLQEHGFTEVTEVNC